MIPPVVLKIDSHEPNSGRAPAQSSSVRTLLVVLLIYSSPDFLPVSLSYGRQAGFSVRNYIHIINKSGTVTIDITVVIKTVFAASFSSPPYSVANKTLVFATGIRIRI